MSAAQVLPNVRGSLQEVLFAQRLADNEKKNRDKALKKLQKFLGVKSSNGPGFTDDDAIKVWKGLFYCMYMADKPLVQENVAEEISYLIHHLGNLQDRHTFTKAAFNTFAREWNGIDVFRIDKFMMFVRRVLRQVFVHLQMQEWDLKEVAMYANILDVCIVRADDNTNNVPLGLKLHLCSIIMEELAKIGGEKLEHKIIVVVIQPFLKVLALSKIKLYRKTVSEDIIRHLMRQSDMGIQYEETLAETLYGGGKDDKVEEENVGAAQSEDVEMTDDRSEEEFVLDPRAGNVHAVIPQLYPDFNILADALQDVGSLKKVSTVNRNLIYDLVKELRDLAQEVYPLAIPGLNDESDMEDSEEEEEKAVKRLQKFYEDLKGPVKTNIDEMGDLKSDALSKFSIKERRLSKKIKKKKLKPVIKKIRTLKEKQALAKQQRAAAINRKKAVEEKVRQIASATKTAKRKKTARSDNTENDLQIEGKKTGGFEVSTITFDTKKDKNELSEVNSFEVNAITSKIKIEKKRKSQDESVKKIKKIKNDFEVTELSSPHTLKTEKGLKKKKQKANKSDVKVEKNKKKGKGTDPENCKDGVNSIEIDEQLPKKKKEIHVTKKSVMESRTLGSTGVGTIKDNKSKITKVSTTFDVPEFHSFQTEIPSQEKSPSTKGSNEETIKAKSKSTKGSNEETIKAKSKSTKGSNEEASKAVSKSTKGGNEETSKAKSKSTKGSNEETSKAKAKSTKDSDEEISKAKSKARYQESPKEKLEIKTSEMEIAIAGVMRNSKGKLKKTVVTPSCTGAHTVKKSPASMKNKGLVLNFSPNKTESVWSKPLKEGEIEVFIKSKRQIKLDKKRRAAFSSPKGGTPKTPRERSIKINLKQNQEHNLEDYAHSVMNSPQIPFSADKLPKAPVLKVSPSPILVKRPALKILKSFIRKSSPNVNAASPRLKHKSPKRQKLKRSKAADFF